MGIYVSKNEALKCDLVELFGEQEENIEIAAQSSKGSVSPGTFANNVCFT